MVDTGRYIHEATAWLPVIGDGDTGYGNAMNVKRTVRGDAQAGFAGVLIEDQVAPKSCGHVRGKRVCSREEAVSRVSEGPWSRHGGELGRGISLRPGDFTGLPEGPRRVRREG